MKKHTVIFEPAGKTTEVNDGVTLLEAAARAGAGLDSICGGSGICGKCRVVVKDGMPALSAPSDTEKKFIRPEEGPVRLACESLIYGDVTVHVPPAAMISRKATRKVSANLNPAVKKYSVKINPPSMQDMGQGDRERLLDALRAQHGLSGLSLDFNILKGLQKTLRDSLWEVTASVWMGREIIRLEPSVSGTAYGLAVDIGTTTVAAYLCDLVSGNILDTFSATNPQASHGEDVMSRITFAMTNSDGLSVMQGEIRECLNGIIKETGLSPEDIMDMTVVCNTVMHHILLGIDPAGIGAAPFVQSVRRSLYVKARELGININGSSYIHVLPTASGFIGADSAGVLIALRPYNQDKKVLIIDVGTNGEILIGDRNGVYSASCATGPAFEGERIKYGMRAFAGAIERVWIDAETKEPSLEIIGNVRARGICGSGIIDAVAGLYRAGIIDKSGRLRLEPLRANGLPHTERLRLDAEGRPEFVLAWKEQTETGTDITITQADVRAVQLAKAALYAGTKLLMRRMGIEKIDRIILAGAFGSYINKKSALVIGMLPECAPEDISAAGNAAGEGAVLALLDTEKREEAEREVLKLRHLEISIDPDFQEEFLSAMDIPHR